MKMNKLKTTLIGLFVILSVTASVSVSTATSPRQALVIGNSKYSYSPLKNPENDAQDIAASLRNLGFEVIEKINIDRRAMLDSINDFHHKLRKAEVGLFYFAGHGVQIEGRNFLIPIGANVESASDVQFEAIEAGRVLGKMEDAGNKLNIVVLDACRNNPFRSMFRSYQPGLAFMSAPSGTLIAYATAPGEVAHDGLGRNGIYTSHLLKNISNPNLSLIELFNQTALDVSRATSLKQSPWIYNTGMEKYYLSQRADNLGSDQNAQAEAVIIVRSNVYDDEVLIDGVSYGSTKLKQLVSPGKHTIVVLKKGYFNWETDVVVEPGESKTVVASLVRITGGEQDETQEVISAWKRNISNRSGSTGSQGSDDSVSNGSGVTRQQEMINKWKKLQESRSR